MLGEEGGPQWEVWLFYITAGLAILLHNCVHRVAPAPVQPSAGREQQNRGCQIGWFILEFGTLVLPMVLVQTMLANHMLTLAGSLLLTIIWVVATKWRTHFGLHFHNLTRLAHESLSGVESREAVRNSIVAFRALVLIATTTAISAVDFPIYPARFRKCTTYGHSVMDTGTAAFIFINALADYSAATAADAESTVNAGIKVGRKEIATQRISYITICSVRIPTLLLLLCCGVGRTLLIAVSGYGQDVTEYGVHWNFFYTLFFIRLYAQLVPYPASISLGLAIGLAYQLALSTTPLESWLLREEDSKERVGLIDQNREGIFSTFGYLLLYAMSLQCVNLTIPRVRADRQLKPAPIAYGLGIAAVSYAAQVASEWLLHTMPSRRIANAAYALSMLALFQFSLSGLQLLNYFISPKKSADRHNNCRRGLMQAISRNGLRFFLAANLLTGAINILIPSLASWGVRGGWWETLVITLYSLSLAILATLFDSVPPRRFDHDSALIKSD